MSWVSAAPERRALRGSRHHRIQFRKDLLTFETPAPALTAASISGAEIHGRDESAGRVRTFVPNRPAHLPGDQGDDVSMQRLPRGRHAATREPSPPPQVGWRRKVGSLRNRTVPRFKFMTVAAVVFAVAAA